MTLYRRQLIMNAVSGSCCYIRVCNGDTSAGVELPRIRPYQIRAVTGPGTLPLYTVLYLYCILSGITIYEYTSACLNMLYGWQIMWYC